MKSIEREITTQESKELVIDEIRQLPEGKWTVKIFPWAEKMSTKQRRTIWKWNKEIGKAWGWDEEDVHIWLKEKFLIRIRYDDEPDFAMVADKITEMEDSDRALFRGWVIKEVSITKLNVEQAARYMTKVKMFCFHQRINITIPPDKEWEFMCGIKKGGATK